MGILIQLLRESATSGLSVPGRVRASTITISSVQCVLHKAYRSFHGGQGCRDTRTSTCLETVMSPERSSREMAGTPERDEMVRRRQQVGNGLGLASLTLELAD